MAAIPPDAPFGGRFEIGPGPGPASHDDAGLRLRFEGPPDGGTFAIDIERKTGAPPRLARRLGAGGLRAWTEIEVRAKLSGIPAHLVLLRGGAHGGIEIRRADTDTHWIAVGRLCP